MNIRQKATAVLRVLPVKVTPDTALRQVADEHFKVRFRTFEIDSKGKFTFKEPQSQLKK